MNSSKSLILAGYNIFYEVADKLLIENINIRISEKQIITIIGPNGGGKTTLIKILAGLVKPSKGSLYVKEGTIIGYMPQKINIPSNLFISVENFLSINPSIKMSAAEQKEIIKMLGLNKILNTSLNKVSGGELQKILLAYNIFSKPNLLLMDEPTQGVDVMGQADFYDKIENLRQSYNLSIVIISHDLYMVMKKTDHVICMNSHICCEGEPQMINNNPIYLNLFGASNLKNLGLYQHNHNHDHL